MEACGLRVRRGAGAGGAGMTAERGSAVMIRAIFGGGAVRHRIDEVRFVEARGSENGGPFLRVTATGVSGAGGNGGGAAERGCVR